jgi:hypothetical protein
MATKKTRTIGRDAETGRIIPVEQARRDKKGAVVEKVPVPAKRPAKKSK